MIPLANLSAPVGVGEWDVADSSAPIAGCGGCSAARVLVRRDGHPMAWVTVESPDDPLSFSILSAALLDQLGWPLELAAVTQSFAEAETPEPIAMPPISVIVCTRDRAESLRRCLESLARLDFPEYEVIVVDNASISGETAAVAAGLPVRYVREERPGLDWARNRGIAEARHSIVAFTDDDVLVDRLWLRGLARGFVQPDVMLVTGLVVPGELATEAQIIFEYRYGGMSKGFRPARWDPADLAPNDIIATHHLGLGANMAYRREVFDRVGTFDTALDVGTPSHGAGDLDMFHRVLVEGLVACYQPDAMVWHFHRRELAALHRQLRDNGRSFGVYLLSQFFPVAPRRRRFGRGRVLGYATVWVRWMLGRMVRRFLRKETMSLPLQVSELFGVLEAPWAFLATRRSDRRIRRRSPEA